MEFTEVKIQRLINSMYFGLETVFIMETEKSFRLIGLNGGITLIDKDYPTSRGAKIAFSRHYERRTSRLVMNTEWSHSYPVEAGWLKPKLEICENARAQREGFGKQLIQEVV